MKEEMKMKMKRTVLLLGIAGILLAAMISPVAAADNSTVSDGAADTGAPGEEYISYCVNFTDPATPDTKSNLTWFNISDWNNSVVSNPAEYDDIVNISLWNATPTTPVYIGHNESFSGFPVNMTLSNYTVSDGAYANITVNITLNTAGLIDGKEIAFNATLDYVYNTTSGANTTDNANDPAAETIEVLDATAGKSEEIAWEGNTNVLCANVTITPGNTTATQYLKKITINNTATAPRIDPAYIESFGLWNNSDVNGFDPTLDYLINTSAPTEGSNVTFNLTNLALDNRTILATGGTFFLTMNITKPAHTGKYEATIFKQNITINQTANEGNTGNSTDTTGFTLLWIDPADVDVYDAPLKHISPGKAYAAYNITYYENLSDTTGANLTWFNVTEMNATVGNNASLNDITNVSVWNSTHWFCINYSTTASSFNVNLTNMSTGNPITAANNSTYNLTIMLTTNRTMDTGNWFKNVSINATLVCNETAGIGGINASDPEPERITRVEINEIMYNPDDNEQDTDAHLEWVELHNTNQTASIDVSGWNLTTNNNTKSMIMPAGTVIEPDGYLIIARDNVSFKSYYHWVNKSLIIANGSMGLVNEVASNKTMIVLKNASDTEIDNVTYDNGWGAGNNGYTLERNGNEYVNQSDMWNQSNSYSGTPLDINSIIDPEPYITDYFSHNTTITKLSSTTFGVKANKTVDVTWYKNGSKVHENVSVPADTWANYTKNVVEIGLWNITATINGSPVNDTMTWIWDCGRIYDSQEDLVSPGKNYFAYNITYTNTTGPANLTWFNVTGLNTSATPMGDIEDVVNVTAYNATGSTEFLAYNSTRLSTSPYFTVNLSNPQVGSPINSSNYKLSVNLTVATIDPWENNNISVNAKLHTHNYSNGYDKELWANDTAGEYTQYTTPDGNPHTATTSLDSDTYGPGSTATISVNDQDYNRDTSFAEKVVARAWNTTNTSKPYIEVRLTETGADTGIFNGSITLDEEATTHDDVNDILGMRGADTVYVEFKDNEDVDYNVQYPEDKAAFELTRTGTVTLNKPVYNTSETARASVEDPDLDTSNAKDPVNVKVNSTQNLTGYYENVTLTLDETDVHSYTFNGTFNFTTTGSSTGSTLRVNSSTITTVFDTVTATYVDAKNASYKENITTDTAAFNNTHTGSVSLNESVYKDESALNVTMYDPDLNYPAERTYVTNASNYTLMFINTTNLTAYSEDPSSYDSENITNVTEYIGDTGWFMNDTIILNTTSPGIAPKDNGSLYVAPGESFAVCYFDYNDSYGTNYSIYAPDDVANCTDYATASTLETAAVSVWWNETGNISGTAINVTSDNVWGRDTVARISIDDADGGGIDVTDAPDNISVNVNSTENTTGIWLNLTETGATTGVFNGTLMFGTESSAATRTIEVNSSDSELVNTVIGVNFNDTENVTAGIEWGNVSFTHWWSVNGTAKIKNGTGVWGTPTSNVIFYNTTTATVQVTDSDRNNDTSIYNNFTVTMVSNASGSIDTLDLLLNETGNNTGLFSNASLNFSEAGDPLKLNVSDGCYINISYKDTNTSLGNVSTWFNDTYGTYKKTRTGTVGLWELNPTVGESGNITLTDYDRNVTAGYDTVNVDVWSNTSEAESKTITVTLNQTSPTAETFNGTLRFSTADSNESNNQIMVSDGDNVTIKYVDPLNRSGLQETFTNNSAWVVVRYSGAVTFDKTRYNPTETALITLSDQDLNAETGIAETRTVNVNSSAYGTGITVTLKETGANTGIFNRTITFTLAPSPANESGRIINVTIGGTINVTYVDAVNETGATDVNIIANAGIVKATTDVLSLDKTYYNAAATATINVTDADLNTDSGLAEVYYAGTSPWSNVSVNSSSDLTGFNVSIEETGYNTGIFFGTFTFNTTIAASDATNKILKVANNDTINVTYINTKNVTGVQETVVTMARFDNLAPVISNLGSDVNLTKAGEVTITVGVSDNISSLSATPTVTVNDNPTSYVSVSDNTYTYNYTVTASDAEGFATVNVSATDNATNVATLSNATLFKIDLSAPTFSNWTPAESAIVSKNTTISVNYTDASSINASSVVMKVNGVEVTEAITATGVSYTATNLPDGANNASVSVADELGQSNTTLWNFTVDENPPVITGEIPNKTNSTQPTIGATITDLVTGVNESTIVLKVDGSTIPSTAWDFVYDSANKTGDLTYITPTTISYSETEHTVELNVRDNANLLAQASWSFTVDLTNPTVSVGVDKDTVNVSENATITVTATDTVTEAESMIVTVTVGTTSVSLTRGGSNWTGVFATDVADTYTVTAKATDEAENSATDMTSVEVKVEEQALTVTANVSSVVVNTPTDVEFNVTSDGTAIDNATVTVSQAGTELVNGTTASTGLVTLSVNATSAGIVNVTASADGYTDGTMKITATTGVVKGDFDGDGDIDWDDFLAFADAYGATSCADPNYNSIADFDDDCDVDWDDFLAFADVYSV